MSPELVQLSKFLSYVLRHRPGKINLAPDKNGWVATDELIEKANQHGMALDIETLYRVVAENDKQRFAFNQDKTRIRASQGHSIQVELDLQPAVPPKILYHGTVEKFMNAIGREGLKKMNRQHVHLSAGVATASKVGGRRGKPVILTIQAGLMHAAGFVFYISENGVWLTDAVPPEYISRYASD
jgi:putative RNA 2'-phosphotransferase